MIATVVPSGILEFGSDVDMRRRYFTPESFAHPAKLHLGLLAWLVERYTRPGETLGDPMAGSGSLLLALTQGRHVIARDIAYVSLIEANADRIRRQPTLTPLGHADIAYGDARQPWGWTADHLIFSPPYACEVRSPSNLPSYLSTEARQRLTGRRWESLRRKVQAGTGASLLFRYSDHPAQVGHLRGMAYWAAMREVYGHAFAALQRGGVMALVIKDHIKDGQRVRVADHTVTLCEGLGFDLLDRHQRRVFPLSLWQRRRKERGAPVVEDEDILVFIFIPKMARCLTRISPRPHPTPGVQLTPGETPSPPSSPSSSP